MTNNSFSRDEEKFISVEGMDNAFEVAKVLLKNDYEVFIELDDCDIYIIHYAYAKYKRFGNDAFYRISEEDAEMLYNIHSQKEQDEEK